MSKDIDKKIMGAPLNVIMFYSGMLHAMSQKLLHEIPDMNVDWWLRENPTFRALDEVGNFVRLPDLLIVDFSSFQMSIDFVLTHDDIDLIKALYLKMGIEYVIIGHNKEHKLTAVFHHDKKGKELNRMKFLLTLPNNVILDVIDQFGRTNAVKQKALELDDLRKDTLRQFQSLTKGALGFYGTSVNDKSFRRFNDLEFMDLRAADPLLLGKLHYNHAVGAGLYEVSLPPFELNEEQKQLFRTYMSTFFEKVFVIFDENNLKPIKIWFIGVEGQEDQFSKPYDYFKAYFTNEECEMWLNQARQMKENTMSVEKVSTRLENIRAVGPDDLDEMIHNSITQITTFINGKLMDEPYLIANNCVSTSTRGTMYEIDLKEMGELYPSVKQGLESKFMGSGWTAVEYNSTTLKIALIDDRKRAAGEA